VRQSDPHEFAPRRWCLCAVAIVLALAAVARPAGAAGQKRTYGDIEITELEIPRAESCHGYAAYRYTVANRSSSKAHTVTLRLPNERYQDSVIAAQTVELAPGAVTTMALLQPPLQMKGDGLSIDIDGKSQRPMSIGLGPHMGGGYHVMCLLTSPKASRPFQDATRGMVGSGHVQEPNVENTDLPVSQWATTWLAYSRYDALIVAGDEFTAMPPAVRQAVVRYVECGGNLLIAGPAHLPQHWREQETLWMGMRQYTLGFGRCVIAPANLATMTDTQWSRLYENWQQTIRQRGATHSVRQANRAFPVVESLQTPTGPMFAVMLAFVILAGPVNLIVLAKLRKRTWMFWTVPAASLVTCVAIFLYSFIAEGWDGHTRTAAMTILDQRSHHAATVAWTAFYSPMTPGGGLHFGRESEVIPQWDSEYDDDFYYSSNREMSGRGDLRVDWTNDQHLTGGWVSARVPVHFNVRKAETRRERLNITVSDDGSITVVNGLGARITALYLADAKGRIHTASVIEPGAQAVLKPSQEHFRPAGAEGLERLHTRLRGNPVHSTDFNASTFVVALQPNSYLADLDGAPFVEAALDGAEEGKSRSVVYGIFGGGDGS